MTQGYGNFILAQMQDMPVNEPVITDVVADAMAGAYGIDKERARKITNVIRRY